MSAISVLSSAAQILSRPDSYPVYIVLICSRRCVATIVFTLFQKRADRFDHHNVAHTLRIR
jgi:hypothetical protein